MDSIFLNSGVELGFGAKDITSDSMGRAIEQWFRLFYGAGDGERFDPCLQIPYTVVRKLTRGVFSEFSAASDGPATAAILKGLDAVASRAVEMALVGGECYLKPVTDGKNWFFRLLDRRDVLIFGRDLLGNIVDIGTAERSVSGRNYFTLLERRRLQGDTLVIENRLFRSAIAGQLGRGVALSEHPLYAGLPERFEIPGMKGVGFVTVKNPAANCVDGSFDGVSVYAPAVGLIRHLEENEAQLAEEFRRGQSRILVSRDLLTEGQLKDHVFVGLDEDPGQIGISIFAPELREASYLARKQAYLRDVENILGLKRGILSQVEAAQRTATEITSSQGEYALTILDFQRMWHRAVLEAVGLCRSLAAIYGMEADRQEVRLSWGDGLLWEESLC